MIDCHNHDYIEIVCMHQYPIDLALKSGETLNCIAIDTAQNEAREECIKVKVDGTLRLVNLEEISKLKIRIENPHFNEVSFN